MQVLVAYTNDQVSLESLRLSPLAPLFSKIPTQVEVEAGSKRKRLEKSSDVEFEEPRPKRQRKKDIKFTPVSTGRKSSSPRKPKPTTKEYSVRVKKEYRRTPSLGRFQ